MHATMHYVPYRLFERLDAWEQRLVLLVFATAAIASFTGVYWHMWRKMRPRVTDARAGRDDAHRAEGVPARRAEAERPFAGREGIVGAVVLGTIMAVLCAYLVFRSGVSPVRVVGPVAGFAAGHVLVYATTRPRGLGSWLCAFWMVVSAVGLYLLLDAVPLGALLDAGTDGARAWAPPVLGFLVALAVSSATRLSTLLGSGRWRRS